MELIIKLLLSVVVVEAITNIITKSQIFSPIRKFLFTRNEYIHDLLECGYCMSVWIGWFVGICWFYLDYRVFDVFFGGLVLHRLSNMLHFLIDWLDRTRDLE